MRARSAPSLSLRSSAVVCDIGSSIAAPRTAARSRDCSNVRLRVESSGLLLQKRLQIENRHDRRRRIDDALAIGKPVQAIETVPADERLEDCVLGQDPLRADARLNRDSDAAEVRT